MRRQEEVIEATSSFRVFRVFRGSTLLDEAASPQDLRAKFSREA
jgi:hypothetical protein